jgi:hypothetical protein
MDFFFVNGYNIKNKEIIELSVDEEELTRKSFALR